MQGAKQQHNQADNDRTDYDDTPGNEQGNHQTLNAFMPIEPPGFLLLFIHSRILYNTLNCTKDCWSFKKTT